MTGDMASGISSTLALAPLVITGGAACVALLLGVLAGARARWAVTWLSVLASAAVVLVAALALPQAGRAQPMFSDMWVADRMALVFDLIIAASAGMSLIVFRPFAREHVFEQDEFPALVLFSAAGMIMVVHASHLLSLLIGIETMSLAAYALVAGRYHSGQGAEGALKYFLMGALATGFFVYGMALVYGTTGGELSFSGIAARGGQAGNNPLFVIGVLLILVALLFKVAGVPFHMWLPDAYEGAPTPVTGFMAAGIKAAAFGGLLRLFGSAFAAPQVALGHAGWARLVGLVAFASMTLGNLAAIRQDNVKRMLAYSSIAHAGYLLVGMAAVGFGVAAAKPALIFYLAAYAATTLGAFAVASWVGRKGDECQHVDDWAGLGRKRPALALVMTLFLLSLAGFPPTGGFFAKFYLFRSAVERPELIWLVVAAVLNSVVSVYYYLRIVVAMYFRERTDSREGYPSLATGVVLVLLAVLVLGLGIVPAPMMALVQ
jgi:NADH-quinone oxidoreductase subunit N